MKYQTLEDISSAFIQATEAETEALFQQGDVLVTAVKSGFRRSEVVRHCAGLIRRRERTVYTRYQTSAIFTPDKRNPEVDWWIHYICSTTYKPDEPETVNLPYEWLAKAAEENMSGDDLHKAIKASGGNPDADKPEYLLKNVEAKVFTAHYSHRLITLALECDIPNVIDAAIIDGARVLVTIVQPAQAPAKELPV